MTKKIMVCQWGATMILQDFFEVLKETPKTMLVRQLKEKVVENVGLLKTRVVASDELDLDWDFTKPVDPTTGKHPRTKEKLLRLYRRNDQWISRRQGYTKFFKVWDGTPQYVDEAD